MVVQINRIFKLNYCEHNIKLLKILKWYLCCDIENFIPQFSSLNPFSRVIFWLFQQNFRFGLYKI